MLEVCLKKGCSKENRVRVKGDPAQISCRLCSTCQEWIPLVTPNSITKQRFEQWHKIITSISWLIICISVIKIGFGWYVDNEKEEVITTQSSNQGFVGKYIDVSKYQEMEITDIEQITADSIHFKYTLKGGGDRNKDKLGWIVLESQQIYFETEGEGRVTDNAPITLTSNKNEWEFRKRQ